MAFSKGAPSLWAFWVLFAILCCVVQCEPPDSEKQALLKFINGIKHEARLHWNESDSVCNWVGVSCSDDKSFVFTLRLPGVGLIGDIKTGTLSGLTQLRILSLRSNRLTGPIPEDFSNLSLLRSLYLQNNAFSGGFPAGLTELTRLTRLDISGNRFNGSVPFEVNKLTKLTGLFLQDNGFVGVLPSIDIKGLEGFNVSNNKLNGSIPKTLSGFKESSFEGNKGLCGKPLEDCGEGFFPRADAPAPGPEGGVVVGKKSKGISKGAVVGISVGCGLLALALLLCLLLCCCKRRRKGVGSEAKTVPSGGTTRGVGDPSVDFTGTTSSSKEEVGGGSGEAERNKLVFLDSGVYGFDLEDLLRASAEVLGKGSVGTSYKAVLEEGTIVVVKRLREVSVTKKEFEVVLEGLGKVRHDNVLPLRAFYYSKDEKLLVYDFVDNGSLSALLHGSRGSGRTPLNWDNRMKIALSTARGLSYLHVSGKTIHGNIKASNILLSSDLDARVSDYGLNLVFGPLTPIHRIAGYRAPEVLETRKVTYKSDVYSYGVLLLELLTGKAPNQASLGDEGIDLPRWVQSVVREEWTAEVFDVELMRFHNIEEEMVQLLQIAMTCVSTVPDQRPTMPEVVRMIEELNRNETDDSLRLSSDDPSKSGGHTPPPEIRTPPRTALTP